MPSEEASGPGGNWTALNESEPGTVVKQQDRHACAAACGELLSEGHVSQEAFLDEIGAPSTPALLAAALNARAAPGESWEGGYFEFPEQEVEVLLQSPQPWAAVMRAVHGRHMIVVDGIGNEGRVAVRDPWQGTVYAVARAEFVADFRGAVYRP